VGAPTGPRTGWVERPSLGAVFFATFFVRFAFGITLAVFASYITGKSIGLGGSDYGTVGLVSAMAPVGEFSTVLLSGAAADRWGRFPVLFAGMGGSAVLFGLVTLTRAPIFLAGVNLAFGVASGAILAASLAVVGDLAGADERGYEMGRFDAVNLFGWIAGFAVGLVAFGSLPNARLGLVFLFGAVVLAGGLALAAVLVRREPIARGSPSYQLGRVLRTVFRRSVLLVTLPWLSIYMLIGTALVFLGVSANGVGVSPIYLGVLIAGGGSLLVVTQPYFGRLADREGRTRMMAIGASGFVALMAFASLLVAYGPRTPLLVAVGVSTLVALTYGPAALAALADLTSEISRATTMAIYSLTISLGMLLGLLLSTQLYARLGNGGLYLFFGALAVALAGLTLARYRERPTERSVPLTTPAR